MSGVSCARCAALVGGYPCGVCGHDPSDPSRVGNIERRRTVTAKAILLACSCLPALATPPR